MTDSDIKHTGTGDAYSQKPAISLDAETDEQSINQAHPEIDERKLIRKIDFYVVPWLALLYLLNFLDRSNIGNARVRQSHPLF